MSAERFDPGKRFWIQYGGKFFYGAQPHEPYYKLVNWYKAQATCIVCSGQFTWRHIRNVIWQKLRHDFFEIVAPYRNRIKPGQDLGDDFYRN